jgi:serine protease AprX
MFGAAPSATAAQRTNRVSKRTAGDQTHRENKPRARDGRPNSFARAYRLDEDLTRRSRGRGQGRSSVIVRLAPGATLPNDFRKYVQGRKTSTLDLIGGIVLDLPDNVLAKLAGHGSVFQVHHNRAVTSSNYRTAVTVGARAVNELMGLTGKGVGVAVIDSGITTFHDDLRVGAGITTVFPYGNQRVSKFVDIVHGQVLPYDDSGHGSHVAGVVSGSGDDSGGSKAGMAPDASIVALKVLDANGTGTIADIIAALNWVDVNRVQYNIRVVNLSVGAAVRESYWTDPLTLAVKALTDHGIVVVAAAGNIGTSPEGLPQYGGITAPGNAPWVLTVGASSTAGTPTRTDDIMAPYSSRGPTFLDWSAKPDLVAPGTGTMSLAVPGSTLYQTKPLALVSGTVDPSGMKPYLALSGTSMAAPVVSGTVALMIQANPNLTPNLVKGILQYTAQVYANYDGLTQGAGFVNTLGAVRLAKFYHEARPGDRVPTQAIWSRHVIWGSHVITGGVIVPSMNAWSTSVVWGSARTLGSEGDEIAWGVAGWPSPLAAALGEASEFAIAGAAGVTSAGGAGTIVDGNVGASPTASITGFGPAVVVPPFGIHANDAAAMAAHAASVALFTTLGSGDCSDSPGAQMNGANFGPGIHCFASTADLAATGTMTLTGAGVYIFRIPTALTANVLSSVVLAAGANACNVFWQVGSAATLNGVNFPGNVVAQAAVTIGVGARLNGRALVTTGPVTMAGSNTVGGCSTATAGTSSSDSIIWGTSSADSIIWGTNDGASIIWGTSVGNSIIWGTSAGASIIWGTSSDGDSIIWGTADSANIVWGADCGGADCDTVIWGSSDGQSIIWGTASDGDSIIWGTAGDRDSIIWGTGGRDSIIWGTDQDGAAFSNEDASAPRPSLQLEFGDAVPIGGR